jgi:protein ImuB
MPFACIFVPDFSVEAILRAEPELRSQALAVLEGEAPLQKVFAVNEKAHRAGVVPGMTRVQVEACPNLALRERSLLQESTAHAALLDCAQAFSPRVEETGADTVILDVAGLQTLFGPLPKIARDLAQRVSLAGLVSSVAIAENPDTAVLAARGFSGVTVVPQGKEAEQLSSLPIEVLFTEHDAEVEKFLETLHRWGIRTLRELAALPDIGLSERLGQRGVEGRKLARGETFRTLVPVEPPVIFEEVVELEYPIVLLEPLALLLARMLDQLCARLQARALATQELRLELELKNGHEEDCDECVGTGALVSLSRAESRDPGRAQARQLFRRTLHLPLPLLDGKTFLKLLQLDLKAHPPGAPIAKIHLTAEPARPRAAQNGLFLPPSPEPEKLELTMAKIAGIVGEGGVGSLELLNTHRPEGFEMQHFAPCEELRHGFTRINTDSLNKEKPSVTQCLRGEDLVTALRMFRPPARATVTVREGKPAHISCARRKEIHGEILWTAGPWRSSGDWWEHTGWARDEWDIAVQEEAGVAFYRLVRDLLSGRWFVEGTYD